MKATAEKIENNKVSLQIEVEAEKFDAALDKAYLKVVKQVNVPGFRKGKVPRAILEKQYGKGVLIEEALDLLIPEAYFQAVQETGIEPVDRPEVELVQAEDGQPVIFKAVVLVKPEVKLGEYTGLEVTKGEVQVGDAEVEAELNKMQTRHAKLVTLDEGEVQMGDTAVIDFKGFVDDVPFAGGDGMNHPLEIGSGTFIPGFEEQVVGAKTGEEVDVKVSFPEEYHATDLAGKPALFKVKVNSIRRKELTPIDDEFAKDVSEFDTLEELKADILNKLRQTAEEEATASLKNQAIAQAVENAEVEIPEVMVDAKIDDMMNTMSQRMRMQGISLEDYCRLANTDMDQIREQMRDDARQRVKSDLVLEAISKAENIQVSDEDLEQEFAKMAEKFNQDVDSIKSYFGAQGNIAMVKQDIAIERTIDLLVEKAIIA